MTWCAFKLVLGTSDKMITLYFAPYTFSWLRILWDTGKSDYKQTGHDEVRSVKIPFNTRVLRIEIDDGTNEKAFILSSSNGILLDTSWECTSNKNNGVWPSAIVAKSGAKDLPNVSSKAQWIWTDDQKDTRVVCKKTLIGEE